MSVSNLVGTSEAINLLYGYNRYHHIWLKNSEPLGEVSEIDRYSNDQILAENKCRIEEKLDL